MQLPSNTHVAIADGTRFLLMKNAGTATEPRLELVAEPSLDGEDESGGFGHHDAKSDDHHEPDKLDHAASVAAWLNRAVLQHRIERLVVAADPNTLGEMRRHYHSETQAVLAEELDKQLTGMPGPEILRVLEAA